MATPVSIMYGKVSKNLESENSRNETMARTRLRKTKNHNPFISPRPAYIGDRAMDILPRVDYNKPKNNSVDNRRQKQRCTEWVVQGGRRHRAILALKNRCLNQDLIFHGESLRKLIAPV
jgi:hypothetical protein